MPYTDLHETYKRYMNVCVCVYMIWIKYIYMKNEFMGFSSFFDCNCTTKKQKVKALVLRKRKKSTERLDWEMATVVQVENLVSCR